jgi:hypothetical protein
MNITDNIVYKEKYFKYKNKYVKLKNNMNEQRGGMFNSLSNMGIAFFTPLSSTFLFELMENDLFKAEVKNKIDKIDKEYIITYNNIYPWFGFNVISFNVNTKTYYFIITEGSGNQIMGLNVDSNIIINVSISDPATDYYNQSSFSLHPNWKNENKQEHITKFKQFLLDILQEIIYKLK